MDLAPLFKAVVDQQASDVFLKAGATPFIRVQGKLVPFGNARLNKADLLELADELMGAERLHQLQQQRELNFAFEQETIGRFRANALWQRGNLALVIRRVQERSFDFDELHLPTHVFQQLAQERKGLILITGPTGSGKSTTSAAIIDHLNRTTPCHIVTLEDPIEYVYKEQQAVITQREVGVDTKSFQEGLKNVLRQSPDVLYVSDLRDHETMEAALLAAEAGQLVVSCIHTTSALSTIERVVSFFPPHQHETIRFRLSLVLKGIVSMRLLPRREAKGQLPACEILLMTPTIKQLIREGNYDDVPKLIHDGSMHGMQTMNQSLYQLVRSGAVTVEHAIAASEQPHELRLVLQEIRQTGDVRKPPAA